MLFNLDIFKAGLNKCIGIVRDQGNLDTFKSFYLKPSIKDGMVYLAGSDGIMSLLDKIPCEFDDEDTEDVIILPASKLYPIIKCASETLKITNDGTYSAIITSGIGSWTVSKIQDDYSDTIPFDCYDITEFEDTIDAAELLFILEKLASNMGDKTNPNTVYRQLYIDGDGNKAYSATSTYVTIASLDVPGRHIKGNYILQEKVVRALRDLLRGCDGDVKIVRGLDDISVVVRTTTSVFVYTDRSDGDIEEIDEFDKLVLENSIVLRRSDLKNLIASARITSGDSNISIQIQPYTSANRERGKHGLFSIHSEEGDTGSGDTFTGEINIVKGKRTLSSFNNSAKENAQLVSDILNTDTDTDTSTSTDLEVEPHNFSASADNLAGAVNIIKTDLLMLRYSTSANSYYMSISDSKNEYRSIMVVE